MRTAEELRYLILAIQREGNRLLAADLRPLGITPSQAEVIRVLADQGRVHPGSPGTLHFLAGHGAGGPVSPPAPSSRATGPAHTPAALELASRTR